jgi:cobalt-zinc-cadmium efflux system membrane fusion protein
MTPTGNNELGHVNDSRPNPWRRRVVQGVFAIALLIVGMIAGAMWSERRLSRRPADVSPPASVKEPSPMPAAARPDEAIEVALTPEAVQRAGIKTAVVRSESVTSAITVPATVMSNAYRDTKVNALVGGVVRQVGAELGSSVKRGQPLAVIFSAELADAQMKYLSMQAMLQADHQKLERTDKLVKLGAASTQELEEVTAVHASHETEVAAARQRLLLLGLSAADVSRLTDAAHIVSDVGVPSPADGVVIARAVNQGQVVATGQELFTVTDLSTVWVIGDLYEKDFPNVRAGSSATVRISAAPNVALHGRVAYIDPRVDAATRTAKVRVEVPNRNMDLRLGVYVTLNFQTADGQRVLLVPRDAVQSIGERVVVYVATSDDEGRFIERPVKLGSSTGDAVQVIDGLRPGEKVVTTGSFFLRAEAARSRSGG